MPPIPPLNFSSTAASDARAQGNTWGGFGDVSVSYGGGVAGIPPVLLLIGLGVALYMLNKRK